MSCKTMLMAAKSRHCTSVTSEMSAQKGIKEKGQKKCVTKFHSEAETAKCNPKTAARAVHDMKMSAGVKIRAQNRAEGPKGDKK